MKNSWSEVFLWASDLIRLGRLQGHKMDEFGMGGVERLTAFRKVMENHGFAVLMGNGNIFLMRFIGGRLTVIHQRALASRMVKPVFI